MKIQLKYKLTYGTVPTHDEIIMWAFNLKQAIEFGDFVNNDNPKKQRLTKVEQLHETA